MGLLDEVVRQAAQAAGGTPQHSAMASAVAGLIGSQGEGGLESLVQSFQAQGLGDIVSSWVSTGANKPVTGDQVHAALGSGTLQQLSQSAGVSPDAAKTLLAAVLPLIVDKLTPQGTLPKQSSLLAAGLGLLKGRL